MAKINPEHDLPVTLGPAEREKALLHALVDAGVTELTFNRRVLSDQPVARVEIRQTSGSDELTLKVIEPKDPDEEEPEGEEE